MNEKYLGEYIERTTSRNTDLDITDLRGINMRKKFIPSVANTHGSDMSKYRVVFKDQFAYNPMHVGRDRLVPISLLTSDEPIIVSPAYVTFKIIKPTELIPEFLMEWFRRPEFDRLAWFSTDNSVRGGFNWESLINMKIEVPPKKHQAITLLKNALEIENELNRLKRRIIDQVTS